MKYASVLRAFHTTPWAILPAHYDTLAGILHERATGHTPDLDTIRARLAAADPYGADEPDADPPKGVALVPVHGTILNRAGGMLSEVSGVTSPQSLANQVRALADQRDVEEIILSIDSPGGSALNVDEAAAAVAYASSLKPVTAVANGLMASAAYWIGSQASRIVTTPLSMVGSIGVITSHADSTRAYEDEGVDVEIYRTGSLKALGQPTDPNDDTMRASMTSELTRILDVFATAVATGRGMSTEDVLDRYALDSDHPNALKGSTAIGAEAVDLGLADEVASLPDVLSDTITRVSRSSRRRPRTRAATTPVPMKEVQMDLLALLGLPEDATEDQAKAALEKRPAQAVERERARITAALGTEDVADATLQRVTAEAADGRQYRADQLERLHTAVIRAEGNDTAGRDAADRAKRIFGSADLADITAEVDRLEAKLDTIPNTRQSVDQPDEDDDTPAKRRVDYSAVL